jgi:hypothetical protein
MFQLDDFNREKPIWGAELSNGEIVYQDDERPGYEPAIAWRRLRGYCLTGNIYLKNLWLQYFSHKISALPSNVPGYFFSFKNVFLLDSKSNFDYYMIGIVSGDSVIIQNYKIPELLYHGYTIRRVEKCDEESIIWKK